SLVSMKKPPRLTSREWFSTNSATVALLYRTVRLSTLLRGSLRLSFELMVCLLVPGSATPLLRRPPPHFPHNRSDAQPFTLSEAVFRATKCGKNRIRAGLRGGANRTNDARLTYTQERVGLLFEGDRRGGRPLAAGSHLCHLLNA